MKFLVDAQLPARLSEFLSDAGHDALHTRELPGGNRSTDSQIARRVDADERVVVTKDQDFREAHLLTGSPRQLLVVATGNIVECPPSCRSSSSTSMRSSQRSRKPASCS